MTTAQIDAPYVTNQEVARVLFKIASLLELFEDNPYRVRAYRRAALGVLFLPEPLSSYVADDKEIPLPGVGSRLAGRLRDLVNTGHIGVYEALMEDLGEPMASLIGLDGVGPKTAIRLIRELGIGSLDELATAARNGEIQKLRGFGPKKEAHFGQQADELLQRGAA